MRSGPNSEARNLNKVHCNSSVSGNLTIVILYEPQRPGSITIVNLTHLSVLAQCFNGFCTVHQVVEVVKQLQIVNIS